MTKWIGAAILAVTAIVGDAAATSSVAAAPTGAAVQKPHATASDLSARRRYDRGAHYAYRPYYPYYYGRPYYYSPGPFFLPVPPFWGYGWQWW